MKIANEITLKGECEEHVELDGRLLTLIVKDDKAGVTFRLSEYSEYQAHPLLRKYIGESVKVHIEPDELSSTHGRMIGNFFAEVVLGIVYMGVVISMMDIVWKAWIVKAGIPPLPSSFFVGVFFFFLMARIVVNAGHDKAERGSWKQRLSERSARIGAISFLTALAWLLSYAVSFIP